MDECPTCGQHVSNQIAERLDLNVLSVREVFWDRNVHLTNKEAQILAAIRGKNRPISKSMIMDAVYGTDPNGGPSDKTLDVIICKIRQKITKAKLTWRLTTVWGYGYELEERNPSKALKRAGAALALFLAFAHPVASLFG